MTDDTRTPDIRAFADRLPARSLLIVRSRCPSTQTQLLRDLRTHRPTPDVVIALSCAHPPTRLATDAVHIPEAGLRLWRRTDLTRLRPRLVTASAHGYGAIHRAARLGVDAVLLSPVFPTASHPDARCLGLCRFAALARAAAVPVFALGGVTRSNQRRVRAVGAAGIAGIGVFADRARAR